MTSILTIPTNDIITFLREYNIKPQIDNKQNYLLAWNLIKSGNIKSATISIVDFITASNLVTSNVKLSKINITDVLSATDIDLRDLATKLSLLTIDKERIIRILRYTNALIDDINSFTNLPDDIITLILGNLDCKSIFSICKLSPYFNAFCKSGKLNHRNH